jgi:hypothetical protein
VVRRIRSAARLVDIGLGMVLGSQGTVTSPGGG